MNKAVNVLDGNQEEVNCLYILATVNADLKWQNVENRLCQMSK